MSYLHRGSLLTPLSCQFFCGINALGLGLQGITPSALPEVFGPLFSRLRGFLSSLLLFFFRERLYRL
jgi:hypothetical protein